ncbi:MAG: hypothetical protein FWD13_10420, partial [Treponema sp.]|nr:hypothetical protein [Treponema sp.]
MNIFKLKAVRWVISFITIYAVMGFILIACDDCTDPGNGNGNGNGNGGKADGAEVDIPALYASTYSSISIYAVAAPENGQTVEYVINTEDVVPSSGWQNDLFFDGLKADTVYYIFARSRENSNFYAGTPNESLEVSTRDTPVETSVNISQMADVSEIILVIQTALISNNIVTIEGEYTNGDKTLELNLFESRNLIWKAVYSGNANNLILLNGKGNLEIIDGSEITAVSGTAIVFFGTNLTISGGKISAEGDDKHAISSNGNNSYVTVSGGEVSASGNKIRTIWTNG